MSTLYISDLDGTLLNSKAELSQYTISTLNKLIEQGLNFGIATARTDGTAIKMISDVNISVPVILMNGVCIFDIQKAHYVKVEVIERKSVETLLSVLQGHKHTGFLYTLQSDRLITYYENLDKPHMKNFHDERVRIFNKKFEQVNSFADCLDNEIIYFSSADKKDILEPIYNELRLDKGLNAEFYRDIYEDGFWYLEVCCAKASKHNAVQYLREQYGYDKIICFGDNLNDLSMFRASDECYAVENAKEEVKAMATSIIGSNNNDGVVKWIEGNI